MPRQSRFAVKNWKRFTAHKIRRSISL